MGPKMLALQMLCLMIFALQVTSLDVEDSTEVEDDGIRLKEMISLLDNDDNGEMDEDEMESFLDDLDDGRDETDIRTEQKNDPWWFGSRRHRRIHYG